jgi:hypothetical protein
MAASLFGRLAQSRWGRLAPFLLIGPISGPLLAGVVFNIRGRRPILATLYAILLALFIILLPLITARLLSPHA